ncbi:MAG: flagellar hook protein [Aquificota bacterium]|nr:MAG: flagellar hook protein [Aquificota bacterium]
MRVPDIAFFDTFLKHDRIRQKEIEKYTKEIASGKKILAPSDNTLGAVKALRVSELIKDIDTYNRNITNAKNVLDVAESTLGNVVETAQEVRPEIVRILNLGVLDKEDAEVLKDYFKGMRDYIIKTANIKTGDSSIFAGVKSQIDAFDDNGVYQGATEETTVPVAGNVELNTNFNGKEYLGVNEKTNKLVLVEALDKIIQLIDSGDLSDINKPTLDVKVNGKDYGKVTVLEAFDIGLDTVSQHRSMVGEQMVVADNLKAQHETMKVHLNELKSSIEDADYSETITHLEQARTAYQALLASIAQNKELSLLNYMR